MNSVSGHLIDSAFEQRIVRYYEDAGEDYNYWSRGMNMHFGYGNLLAFFSRERMLNEMTCQVARRLDIKTNGSHIVDLGCGVGGSMQVVHEIFPSSRMTGITIVPWQKQRADERINQWSPKHNQILLEDYHSTSLSDECVDAAYAMESTCYSPPNLRPRLFQEVGRTLRPGGKLVIADGFLKTPERFLPPLPKKLYRKICDNWVLAGMMNIDETRRHLHEAGFHDLVFEEVSWKVAPSVAHVPFVITRFLLSKMIRRESLSQQSINNLKGSFLALLLGLHRQHFGYFLVTATKR